MSMDPMDRLRESLRLLRQEGGLPQLMIGLVAGTFVTITFNIWQFVEALGETIMAPFQAFATALASLITGSIGGPVVLLEAAVQTGVVSVTEGLFATFGLFAYPITMASVMLGLYIFAAGWQRIDLSPWAFLRGLRR